MDFGSLADQGPLVAFALLVIGLILKGVLRTEREVKALEADRDYWKAKAEGVVDTLLNATEQVVRKPRR